MNQAFREAIWNQFGAAIDMLTNVIAHTPDDYFQTRKRFYYIAYHSAIFLDYYSTLPPKDFSPMLPFTQLNESEKPLEAIDDLIPNKIYSKKELIEYLQTSRAKCKSIIESLTEDKLNERFIEGDEENDMNYSILEILLYNLRHTQHHTAQLNMLIRQDLDRHTEWSFRAGDIKAN